mgnify:CR=1 FL=1
MTKAAVSKAADLVKENTGIDLPTSKEELNKEAIEKAKEESPSKKDDDLPDLEIDEEGQITLF